MQTLQFESRHRGNAEVCQMPNLLPPSFSFILDEYSLVGSPKTNESEKERKRGEEKTHTTAADSSKRIS